MLITHVLIRDLPNEPWRLLGVMEDGSAIDTNRLADRLVSDIMGENAEVIGKAVYRRIGKLYDQPMYELAGLRGVD